MKNWIHTTLSISIVLFVNACSDQESSSGDITAPAASTPTGDSAATFAEGLARRASHACELLTVQDAGQVLGVQMQDEPELDAQGGKCVFKAADASGLDLSVDWRDADVQAVYESMLAMGTTESIEGLGSRSAYMDAYGHLVVFVEDGQYVSLQTVAVRDEASKQRLVGLARKIAERL